MDNRIWVRIGILVGIYVLYRFMNPQEEKATGVDKEIENIINSKEYKVKGQYED